MGTTTEQHTFQSADEDVGRDRFLLEGEFVVLELDKHRRVLDLDGLLLLVLRGASFRLLLLRSRSGDLRFLGC